MKNEPKSLADAQIGDKLARIKGYDTESEPAFVTRRTPKYLYLDNGEKIHIDGDRSDKWNRYEVWSDESEAKRVAAGRRKVLGWRLNRLLPWQMHGFTIEDVLRNESAFEGYEALLKRQEQERAQAAAKIAAGRPET